MKKLIRLFKKFKASGIVNLGITQRTVEQELIDIGFEFEKCRLSGISIHHDQEISDRYFRALKWARMAQFGRQSINFYIREGGDAYRASSR